MKINLHLIHDEKVCDPKVKVIIDLPAKPCVGDYIVLENKTAKELTALATQHQYDESEIQLPLNRIVTATSILLYEHDQSIHVEVIPLLK